MKPFDPCVVVEALAGAGKTYKLSHRYLQLIEMGADPNSILATTFSKKAAGEMRDRIIETVASAVTDEGKRQELFLGIPNMEQSRKACVRLLRTIVSNLHRLEIGTIDSFFVRTARVFGDEMGFPPQWSILDDLQDKRVMHEAVLSMLHSSNLDSITKTIQLAESSNVVPVISTINNINKYAYDVLRQTGVEPWGWGEHAPTLKSDSLSKAIENLDSVQSEESGQLKTLQKDIERAKSGDWKKFLTTGLPVGIINSTFQFRSRTIDPLIVEALQPIVNHAAAILLNQLLSKNAGIVSLMSAFNESWSAVKHESGLYRFEDVTHYLGECSVLEDLQELTFRLDARIDHLLIDEFQDTSVPQWKVLKCLVDEIHQSSSDRSLFFVGDPKQSLYGFRGGEPHLLRELPRYLGEVNPERLMASWRCSPPVLDLVNSVFEGANKANLLLNHSKVGLSDWLTSFEKHRAARPDRLGYVEIHTTKAGENGKTSLVDTIEKVTDVVRTIHDEAPEATVGILVRKGTQQRIQRIVHALRSHRTNPIMACEYGGNPLTDSPQVTVILSVLLLVDHPGDTASLFHVSTSPLAELLHLKPTSDMKDAQKLSEELRSRLSRVGYATVINDLVAPLFKDASQRDQLRLWQLIELAESYAPDETLRTSDFVEFVKNKNVTDPATSKVQVMTIHAAKGLGFDAVVICDLDEPLWKSPELLTLHDDPCDPPIRVSVRENESFNSIIPEQEEMWEECKSNQVQEALSLLYVAMTRAKHALHLVIPPRPKPSKAKTVDRFLRQAIELPESLPPDDIVWRSKLNINTWAEDVKSENTTSSEYELGLITFATRKTGHRGIATASPSSLERGGKTKVLTRFKRESHDALNWGLIVHKWFENINWSCDEFPTLSFLINSAQADAMCRLSTEQVELAAQAFLTALQSAPIQTLLKKPDEQTSVFNEQEFILRVDKGTSFAGVTMDECTDMRGTIDRLVVFENTDGLPARAEIIDWKTDGFGSTNLTELVAQYAPQLATYRLAAAKLLGLELENVNAKLVFVHEECVQDITEFASVEFPLSFVEKQT